MDIKVVDRQSNTIFQEKVYGARWISLFYQQPFLRIVARAFWFQKIVSWFYGWLQRSKLSGKKVAPFVVNFKVEMSRFVEPKGGFKTFDEFFIRALRPECVQFPTEPKLLGSPCEARLSVFPIENNKASLVVKAKPVLLVDLLDSVVNLLEYNKGHAWVFRLCPVDYHRFHFPDSGKLLLQRRLKGHLHSVNPISLEKIPDVFLQNERQLSLLRTNSFGDIVCLEVGAMCVGLIEQFKSTGDVFLRGEEKGTFHFGGSTVILLTKPGIIPDQDLILNSNKGFESLVRVGEVLGRQS